MPEQSSPSDSLRLVSLSDQIYESLLSQLISLKISPGSRIAIDALVRELGVSQTPIRAALIRLENEGLVVKTHNVGYSATPMPTRQRFEEIYDMRFLIEPYMAARAAARMSHAQRTELSALAKSMTKPASDDVSLAYGKFALQDAVFHNWIAEHGGNDLAADTLKRLHAHTHLFRLRFHSHVTKQAITEHADIVKALVGGDAAKASSAMESHIRKSRARMAPFFEAMD